MSFRPSGNEWNGAPGAKLGATGRSLLRRHRYISMHVRNGGKQCIFSVGRWPVVHTPTRKKFAEACTSDGRGVFRDLGSVVGYWISSFFQLTSMTAAEYEESNHAEFSTKYATLMIRLALSFIHPKELRVLYCNLQGLCFRLPHEP